MGSHLAVLLTAPQARALVKAVDDAEVLRTTFMPNGDERAAEHWQRTEGRVLERAVAAIERAARAEEIEL